MIGDKFGESGAFLFPDVSQISVMIGDFTEISSKSGTVGNSKISDRLGFSRNENQAFKLIEIVSFFWFLLKRFLPN